MDFSTFYYRYLLEHLHPDNRFMHYVGTLFVIVFLLLFLWTQLPVFLLLMPIVGYGCAWFGHFKIEKNTPTTFKHPIWSLRADFLMLYHFLTFQIEREIQKAKDSALPK